MTDETLILKFLDTNFSVVAINGEFCFKDSLTGKVYNISVFTQIFLLVFPFKFTSDGDVPLAICQVWFDARKYDLTKPIYDYLEQCQVRLGISNWEPHLNGVIVNKKTLKDLLPSQNETGIISVIFDKWFEEKIYSTSNNLINDYD